MTIDLSSGSFDGYTWGENIGWIHIKNTGDNAYNVVTTFRSSSNDPETLPETGFRKGHITQLTTHPKSKQYTSTDMGLKIPDLGIHTSIVGVPVAEGEWDLEWLGNQVGWLHGTAFPSWAGNSALTGHAYDANGEPGIFHNLQNLRWGDELIVHTYGQSYVYEVRSVDRFVRPDNTSSVFQHEDFPWLT